MLRSALFAAVCLLAAVPALPANLRVVAYVAGWETLPVIDATKLTHINFAFGKIDGGKVVLPQPDVAAQLAYLRSLKAKNPWLQVLLSVGGWEAEGFSDAASSDRGAQHVRRECRHAAARALARRCRSRLGIPGAERRRDQIAAAGQAELHRAVANHARAARRGQLVSQPRRPLPADDCLGRPRVLRFHADGPAARLSRLDQRDELRLLQQPDPDHRSSRRPVRFALCSADRSQRRRCR